MEKLILTPIANLTGDFVTENEYLQQLHKEADTIQEFMNVKADLLDPTSLTIRLNEMDAYMARLTDMLTRVKGMLETSKAKIHKDNAEVLVTMKTTVANRIISSYLCDINVICNRLETMYNTLFRQSNDLQSQISYIRAQMRC